MISTPHALATAAGLRVLQQGGNAVEAAIAAAAAIAVVYPHMNGIGGDNFWLIHEARARRVRALLACGRAGAACAPEVYRAAGCGDGIPRRGELAANTVPGAVDGWWEAYAFSRGRLDGRMAFANLLADAIFHAESGFPVTPGLEHWTARNIGPASGPFGHLERRDDFRRTFLKPDGTGFRRGERLALPELAESLRSIARDGRDAFYRGPIAQRICAHLRRRGGLLAPADFEAHSSRWEEPLAVDYRGRSLVNTPPPTQGLTSLQLLGILEGFPLAEWGDASAAYVHAMVEATKLAFADRDAWIADPDFSPVPVSDLLSKARAHAYAASIRLDRAAGAAPPRPRPGDTVWLGVADASGNAVSLIQSIYFDFGSAVVPPGTGVVLQNRGASFSLDPADPNVLRAGKRPFHTLNPAMALRDGEPELIYGTMGGDGQPQTQAAVATRILDLGMDVQAAIDAPRWLYGRTWGEASTTLLVESRLPGPVREELRRLGHEVQTAQAWDDRMGHAQAILIDRRRGVLSGGADPRGDGAALGF